MATKIFYLTNTVTDNWQILSESSQGAEAFASPVLGWVVAKVAPTVYASFDSGTERTSAGFSATVQPDGSLDGTLGDSWRSANLLNGTFDAGNWVFKGAVRAQGAATAGGRLRYRVFRSPNADGSSATELTAAVQIGTTVAPGTGATVDSGVTWTPGTTIDITNEYLFVQVAWEITTTSSSNSSDVNFRIGDTTGTFLTTPNYTDNAVYATGVSATGTVGTVSVNTLKEATLTGTSASGTIGTITVATGAGVALSGTSATSSIGTIAPSQAAGKTLTGVSVAGTVGGISVLTSKAATLTGTSTTGSVGTISVLTSKGASLTGVSASGSVGTLTRSQDVGRTLTGVSSTISLGEIYAAEVKTVNLSGITAQGSTGTLSEFNAQNYIYGTIEESIQALSPGSIVDLFVLDSSHIPGGGILRFHNGVNGLGDDITWQGLEYIRFPIFVEGMEFNSNSNGPPPRPTVRVSNIDGLLGALVYSLDDLVTAKLTRKRTFIRYLDAVNFATGNGNADPNVHFADELWFIDRKASQNNIYLEFELASALDITGVKIPHRQCIQNTCTWKYRGPECGYTAAVYFTKGDVPTTVDNDSCGKRLSSCKVRFGQYNPLPYGGFPGVGLL